VEKIVFASINLKMTIKDIYKNVEFDLGDRI